MMGMVGKSEGGKGWEGMGGQIQALLSTDFRSHSLCSATHVKHCGAQVTYVVQV